MKRKLIIEVFNRFAKENPEPRIELDYHSAFTLLIAVLLSAQSTDVQVNKATSALFKVADSPGKMLELGEENLKNYVKSIGLFNTKARNIILLSKKLIEEYSGEVPGTFEALTSLPGIGRKSANVILNSFFYVPTIAVDTHVFRVSNRIGFTRAKSVLDTERDLVQVVPDDRKLLAHHWLVLHGRYVCKAKSPLCIACCINDLCEYNNAHLNRAD